MVLKINNYSYALIKKNVSEMNYQDIKRKLMWLLIFISLVACWATYYVFSLSNLTNINSNYLILVLNIDLFILLILVVIIARKLTKIWFFNKHSNINAAKLHTRFIVLFSLLTITPTILMALFSSLMLNMGVEKWFSERISTALKESTNIAQSYLKEHKQLIVSNVRNMASDIALEYQKFHQDNFNSKFNQITDNFHMDEALIFSLQHAEKIIARSKLSFALEFVDFSSAELKQAATNVVIKHELTSDRVRALIKIDQINAFLIVGRLIDPNVIVRIKEVNNAVSNYYEIEQSQQKLQLFLMLIFMAATLLLLLVAIWMAIVFAERLARPIGELITASEKVCQGDLSVRVVPRKRNDEIALLMESFNRMTSQINNQQKKLIKARNAIDSRRQFIEDILSSVTCGVISIQHDFTINEINDYAANILNINNQDIIIGQHISSCFAEIEALVSNNKINYEQSQQLKIIRNKKLYNLSVYIKNVSYKNSPSPPKDFIITFVDISELLLAQKKAAWTDVARRIAHEIKNPLTPIQLSAEQLRRKYLPQITKDTHKFTNCIETIIRQVNYIGNMMKEFSSFAKLPDPNMQQEDLLKIISQIVAQYKNSNPEINFKINKNKLKKISFLCDAAQISQVLVNIIINSIESIQEYALATPQEGKILIDIQQQNSLLIIKINDNGKGFQSDDLISLMEPYVTTKQKGTGLGLAIVKKIIEDHKGYMSLENDEKWSAVVILKFPL